MNQISRYDVNRLVRTTLVRAGADLGQISHSATDQTVHLYGALVREDGTDFTPAQVESLMESVRRHSGRHAVSTDLTNWDIRVEYGSVSVRRKGKSEGKYANAAPRHFEIEEDTLIRELFDD